MHHFMNFITFSEMLTNTFMMKSGRLYIGTSGWMYKDWGELFYPKDLKKGHLTYLTQEFNTVEINTSFYHLPRKSTFQKWMSEAPPHFRFAVKLSRLITHQKRLRGVRILLETFIQHAEPMKERLGVILIQLPPSLKYDSALLDHFLDDLRIVTGRNYPVRFAIEPRHRTWMEHAKDIRKKLCKDNICIVFPDSEKIPSFPPIDENITADFIYVRFHGPTAFAASRYGKERLLPWAERMKEWLRRGLDVFVYFNNDIHGHAIFDARTIVELMEERGYLLSSS
jgi:uncharacterized protein YecE (DUF72 family)